MNFKKTDENYIYNVIGKNVKKYRKQKNLTQAELAEKINYSLSFISSLESKKYQSFSLGALYRISLILDVKLYELCIDENDDKETYITFECDTCTYQTEIPYEILDSKNLSKITYKCKNCNGLLHPTNIKQEKKDNIELNV